MTIVDLSKYPVHLSVHLTPLTAPQSHSNNRTVSHHSAGEGAGFGCQTKSEAQCQSPHVTSRLAVGKVHGATNEQPSHKRDRGPRSRARSRIEAAYLRLHAEAISRQEATPSSKHKLTRSSDRGEKERESTSYRSPPTPQRTDGSEQEKSGQS